MALTITIKDVFDSFETEFGTEEFAREQYVEGTTTYQFWQGQVVFINNVLDKVESINAQNNIYLMTSIDMLAQFTEPFGYQPIQGRYNLLSLFCNPSFDENISQEDIKKCEFKITKKDVKTNQIIFEDIYIVYFVKGISPGTYLIVESSIKQEILELSGLEVEYLNNVPGVTLSDLRLGGIYYQGMGIETASKYRERFLDTTKDFFISNLENNIANEYSINLSINSRKGFFDIVEYNLIFMKDDVSEEVLYKIVHDIGTSNFYYDVNKPNLSKDITFTDGSTQKIYYNFFDVQELKILLSYSDASKTNDITAQENVIMLLFLFSFNRNNTITQKDVLDYLVSNEVSWINAVSFEIKNQSFFFLEPSTEYFYQIQEDGVFFLNETIT